jgi:hypothetical protein
MQSRNRTFGLNALDFPLVLFLLSAVLGLWPAYDRSACWSTLIALVAGFLLYVMISRLATSRRWWRAIATLIVLAGVLLSLYFVTQYAHFEYTEKVGVIARLGALIGSIAPRAIIWVPVANSVATVLEGVLFLAIALALTAKRPAWRVGGGIGAALIALALLMSASRGAWLAVFVTAVLWGALHWRSARVVVVAGAVLALGLVIYVIVRGDIMVLGDIPVANRVLVPLFLRPDRLHVYRNSVYLIQDFPLTGIGLGGQFPMVLSLYALLIRHPFLSYSHNLYLEVWLQQGLLGAVAWVWLMAALYQAARRVGRSGTDDAGLLYQSTWLGLTTHFVHGITDTRQYVDLWCWLPFFTLLGLNAAVLLRQARAADRRPGWVLPAVAVGLFLVVMVVSLHPVRATWYANQGCVVQALGDLPASLTDEQRDDLRQQAAGLYRRAIQIAPQDQTARQRLGIMLVDEGQFDEAVEHLEIAWRADPRNTTTHKALGLAYVWVGELERARPLLQDVPDIVYELNIWGGWRRTQQQMEQAINAYRMSLLLEPDQPQVRQVLDQLDGELTP